MHASPFPSQATVATQEHVDQYNEQIRVSTAIEKVKTIGDALLYNDYFTAVQRETLNSKYYDLLISL